jgi:hypothetical protein
LIERSITENKVPLVVTNGIIITLFSALVFLPFDKNKKWKIRIFSILVFAKGQKN